MAVLLACGAQAHEVDLAEIPTHGLKADAAIAVTLSDARAALPEATLPGVLGSGQPWRDSRGLRVEHAVAQIAGRSPWGVGGQLAVGVHDRDPAHVEIAWLEGPLGTDWHLGAGRQSVPTTLALNRAGHFDRFAWVPLGKRALFDADWIEEGVALSWRSPRDEPRLWPNRAGGGWWRGRGFPAGGGTPASSSDQPLTVNLGWQLLESVQLDLFTARLRPVARGMLVQSSAGHSHGAPSCDTTLVGRVCFDGRVALHGVSAQWSPDARWTFAATALLRAEHGALYSASGSADYTGRTSGGWVEAAWHAHPHWELAGRAERLVARHDVQGPGAGLVAEEASLLNNQPRQRVTTAVTWRGTDHWRLSAELGADQSAGATNPFLLLRAVWTLDGTASH